MLWSTIMKANDQAYFLVPMETMHHCGVQCGEAVRQTVTQMIRTKYEAWQAAGLNNGETFDFPPPTPTWFLDGN